MTNTDEDRCDECGSRRLFPNTMTEEIVCDECGLVQLSRPISEAAGKPEGPSRDAPKHETRDASHKLLSPEQQGAARTRKRTEQFTRPLKKRQEDRIKNVVETLVQGNLGFTEDEKDSVERLVKSTRSKDGRPLIIRATGAAYYVLMEKHGFVRSEDELVRRAGGKKLLTAAYESFVKLTGRRPESASADSLIDYVVGALHLRRFTGTLAKHTINGLSTEQGFPQYHLKDNRRSAANALWDATHESIFDGKKMRRKEIEVVTKKEIEEVLGLRIRPTRSSQKYRDPDCNPFPFDIRGVPFGRCTEGGRISRPKPAFDEDGYPIEPLKYYPGEARWFPGNGDAGLCNVHAEVYLRDSVKVPRFVRRRGVRRKARWTDFAGKAGLFMRRKSREEWSGGSRRNRDRARDDRKRLLVHITALPPLPYSKRIRVKNRKVVELEDEERRQEHHLFVVDTPGKEALERAEGNPRRVFWCPRCGTEIAVDHNGDAGDNRVMTEFRKPDHPGSRRRPIFIGEPKPSPSWHKFQPARNQGDSLQGHVVYDMDHGLWVVHALYWRIGTNNPDDKRWRWCLDSGEHVHENIVTRPRKGSRLIDRTPYFS